MQQNSTQSLPKVRSLRKKRNWSAERLAREANVSSASVYRAERGPKLPSGKVWAALADALGVTTDELRGEAPSEEPAPEPGDQERAA